MRRPTTACLCCVACAWALTGARARAADAASNPTPSSAPATTGSTDADDEEFEIPPEVIRFFASPGVATTTLFAFDTLARHAAVIEGAVSGGLVGCLVGMATPVALSLVSPALGGPRFDFVEIGGPWWAMLPGAAIGATLVAPLWAASEGLEYEHERRTFLQQVFPAADDDGVPAIIYRDAATAVALGVVSAALPLAAGVGLLSLGTAQPGSAWPLVSIPFFASAVLLAPTVTSSLYPDYVARHDPFLEASRATSEAQIEEFLRLLETLDEQEDPG